MRKKNPVNRRRYPRTREKFIVRVTLLEEPSEEWTLVTTYDLSAGGIRFGYDRKLPDGTELLFKIYFPDRVISCSGTVKRVNKRSLKGPLQYVAARLEGLSLEEKDLLAKIAE